MPRTVRVEDAAALGVGRIVPDLEMTPLRGEKTSVSALLKGKKGLVIALTGATCPMCQKYSSRLASMEREYVAKGIAWVYVNPAEGETRGEMTDQIRKYRIQSPYVPDGEMRIARALGARTTTEMFVVDPSRTLVYRGAVDDQYGIGVTLESARSEYLREALEAVLAGEPRARVRATWSPGCLLDTGAPKGEAEGVPTYEGRIRWIMSEHCAGCHRPGGAANAAPFALDTYEAVNARAKMVEAVVRDGLMPPWHGSARAEGEASPWVVDRTMSRADREALLGWLRSDRPRGERVIEEPGVVSARGTWTIGDPDLILLTSSARLPAEGGLRHARLTVGVPVTEEQWITSFEFRPVEAGSVHHAVVWVLGPGDVLPRADAMPEGLELLGTFSPGDHVVRYPRKSARRLRPGSILLADVYSAPMGREMLVSMRLAMKFAPGEGVEREVKSVVGQMRSAQALEDGEKGVFTGSAEVTLGGDTRVLAIQPSMRSMGREVVVEAVRPDGSTSVLLAAPRYDFRWQIRYEFIEPRGFPAGTRLVARGKFEVPDRERPGLPGFGPGATQEALFLSVETLEGVGVR